MNYVAPKRATEKGPIVDLLTEAFHDNPSVVYLSKNKGRAISETKALMDYSYEVCKEQGIVLQNNHGNACCLLSFPDKKIPALKGISLNVKLIFKCFGIGNISKVLDREKKIKAGYKANNYVYLWYIGTTPKDQGKGIGTKLLQSVIHEYGSKPIYLETSVERNVSWYERYGFEVYQVLQFDKPLYCMIRPAGLLQ